MMKVTLDGDRVYRGPEYLGTAKRTEGGVAFHGRNGYGTAGTMREALAALVALAGYQW